VAETGYKVFGVVLALLATLKAKLVIDDAWFMHRWYYFGSSCHALGQYERCPPILASDLGLEPVPELQELYQRVIGL